MLQKDYPMWNCLKCNRNSYICSFHEREDWKSEDVENGGGEHCGRCRRYMCFPCYRDRSTLLEPMLEHGEVHDARLACPGCSRSERSVQLALNAILFNE